MSDVNPDCTSESIFRFPFHTLTPLVLPVDAWRIDTGLASPNCALVTEMSMIFIPIGDKVVPVASVGGKMPNEIVGGDVAAARQVASLPNDDDPRHEYVRFHYDVLARHLRGRQEGRQATVHEVADPGNSREVTVTYRNPNPCRYLALSSITGFRVAIGDGRVHRQVGVEELPGVASRYVTREYLPQFLAAINAMIAIATDYRLRHLTGLTVDSYRQPYARLLGDQCDQRDRESLLDRPDVTGCVVHVETVLLPALGSNEKHSSSCARGSR